MNSVLSVKPAAWIKDTSFIADYIGECTKDKINNFFSQNNSFAIKLRMKINESVPIVYRRSKDNSVIGLGNIIITDRQLPDIRNYARTFHRFISIAFDKKVHTNNNELDNTDFLNSMYEWENLYDIAPEGSSDFFFYSALNKNTVKKIKTAKGENS